MSARHRLKVGYVGVSITPYFAEKYRVRENAVAALKGFAQELDFDLVAIERPIHSLEQAEAAAREIKAAGVDFLLLQNAACSMGSSCIRLSMPRPSWGSGRFPTHSATARCSSIRWYR